ncbi:hypothetical protein [Carnobacterium inhibens]|uniref:Uncharacterized protein n=1 Tax=Carnobacterium inhibens subsp. gilichinskyi TaxID=1266845 RepID=U5SFK3_9LACT|nr:hypothetical protein [Carnobacterium inhibens]AGY82893.1 hypothetical protein Q783_10840 [Carnobacterium inhibens subsp. gilichinskyi]
MYLVELQQRDRRHTVGLFRKKAVILLQNICLLLMMGELNLSFGIRYLYRVDTL